MNAAILTVGLMLAGWEPPQQAAPPPGESIKPDPAWKELGPSLWFDRDGRRAIVRARVVLREGMLEHLLCKKGTKEHEAILATGAAPQSIHAALLLTGAKVGGPVEFVPKFKPPTGSPIDIELRWRHDGQDQTADARRWVWDEKTKAPLAIDWVFAGSVLYEDRITKKPAYAADDGDLITVANFASAILDLPIVSSANDADRMFTANTKLIPPLGTEVLMILGPRLERKPATLKGAEKAGAGPAASPAR